MRAIKINNKGIRFILWTLGLVTFLGGSFFTIAWTLNLLLGLPLFESENLYLSSTCAVIAWLLTAIFLFGKETILLPVTQPANFLKNVRRVLKEMGYEVSPPVGTSLATKGGFHFLFICRGIHIQWDDKQASITGSKIWVDVLRRRLRVQNFLSNSDILLPEVSQRLSGVLLKRVLLQMRVTPDKLVGVNQNVLQVLAKEADLVCEISIMAKSDAGIRESTLEHQVRPWLTLQGIPTEIHKDLAKMTEPPAPIVLGSRPLVNPPLRTAKQPVAQGK